MRKLLLVAAILVAAAYCIIFYSGVFTIREVRFSGAGTIPRDTLAAIRGDLTGANLVTLSAPRVAKRFRGFPEVKNIVLVRHLFGVLDCAVVRREPVALLACGDLIEVDGEGVMLPKRAGRGDVDLPLITGIDGNKLKRPEGKRSVRTALDVLSIFKDLGFAETNQLSEIHVDGEEVDLVWMGTGTLVKLGRDGYAERVRTLRTVCGAFNESERVPDVIDLRFDRQVVIR
jgi:cell division septal protein FtsQ